MNRRHALAAIVGVSLMTDGRGAITQDARDRDFLKIFFGFGIPVAAMIVAFIYFTNKK